MSKGVARVQTFAGLGVLLRDVLASVGCGERANGFLAWAIGLGDEKEGRAERFCGALLLC